ncbi:MAG: hypothetical protein C4332_11885, partial [Meiothermus sp.]
YRLVGGTGQTAYLEPQQEGLGGRIYSEDRSLPMFVSLNSPTTTTARVGLGPEVQEIALEHGDLPPVVLGAALLLADITAREAWRALLSSYQGIAEG